MRSPAINQSLERTLTRARLSKYLVETGNDFDAAVTLYEKNTHISASLYTCLQGLEVCLRNVINAEMVSFYGPDWLTNERTPLETYARIEIEEASRGLSNPTHNDVVAKLKFAFWIGLLAKRYDSNLWRRALYKAFKGTKIKTRNEVHGRLNALRRFRNRVAHHEPVLNNARQMHDEAIEAIGWMCVDTSQWIAGMSKFNEVSRSLA